MVEIGSDPRHKFTALHGMFSDFPVHVLSAKGGGNEGGKKNKAAFAGELVKSWSLPRTSASLTHAHRRATSSEPEVGVARENGKNNCKMCHISCFPQISTRMGAM